MLHYTVKLFAAFIIIVLLLCLVLVDKALSPQSMEYPVDYSSTTLK